MSISVLLAGFSLGISLILAIGAQNAFVLKQGLKQQHVFVVCLICALSDAILISAGVAGFGAIVQKFPLIEQIARYAGAAFLFFYAAISFKSAITTDHALKAEGKEVGNVVTAVLTCLAFTWLNPHVYLDTFVLLGSISTQYEGQQLAFGVGAVTASFVFFFSLGYGAKLLIPIFKKPVAWKVLEFVVGFIMLVLGISLLI
ncbi:LysE/ArgO family amino acid transporter [Brumicola nitratireducens]|uniref:Putative amino acid transport protein (LysE family) n=1 Tax=Glaciecola nitratireducens (strain JCM 12485 / KCTC 12276 / FR1064) TaxID=1085623 RepID=G4QEI0_GLANF|nr:LysE/ArgO family amino acid transporter [Glaciecola nitratireducens]AEP28743.1 putative amino acid transport protein (LysE family) [Glaciecola nitratireducens FR1064]